MSPPVTTTEEHYDRMIAEIDDPAFPMVSDPCFDTGGLRDRLEEADGPAFWAAVGDVRGQAVLEVGVGTGRVARKMLARGCARLVGLDLSAPTVARARRNLAAYPQAEILQADITTCQLAPAFDLAYLVWTIFHLEDKPAALDHLLAALRPAGRLVLSVERVDEWLDYGPRRIRQHPVTAEALTALI